MNKTKQNIIIVLLVIIIVAMIGGFVFYYLDSKQSNNEKTNQTENNDNTGNNEEQNQTENNIDTPVIIYLDPTDLEKVCTAEDVSKNIFSDGTPNGIKTGCMKWYLYGEKDNSYTMLLAHNTVKNAESTSCNSQPYTSAQPGEEALQELVNLYKWKVTPKLMTLEEINEISPLKTEERPGMGTIYSVEKNNKSNWLFDNLEVADTYDETKSRSYIIYSTASKSYKMLNYSGTISSIIACDDYAGVRPVIEVSKSIIDNK